MGRKTLTESVIKHSPQSGKITHWPHLVLVANVSISFLGASKMVSGSNCPSVPGKVALCLCPQMGECTMCYCWWTVVFCTCRFVR